MRTPDLFGHKKPRAKPRVMAHVFDAGEDVAEFKCAQCGWLSGWLYVASITQGKRGVPCEQCNKPAQQAAQEGGEA